ncbi:M67 family metallopeptidase [Halorussus limi]|uniref:M67 family metallopeptidase n=1 Tax=Halorussus limi TaxID=2938695 RepID=A0A8U0HVE2_9EURY|nr:desampylase [Halorussus limi]UPV75085.1 M67 family metallopeptidase [Halorussus limi]
MPTLRIPESVREEILARAREGAPEEVCGILAGTRESSPRDTDDDHADHRVESHYPAANVAETPRTRYEIDPREQLDLMECIEETGRDVVGFYHSHPRGPAEPSATDAELATWPGRSYLVVSLGADPPEVTSWRWSGDEFAREDLRVVGEE